MPELSDHERDTALDAVALVRLALNKLPSEEAGEMIEVIIGERDEIEAAELMFRLADLAATILEGWYKSLMIALPESAHHEVATPEQLLDDLVQLIVVGEPPEEE